jgi:PLP dependent protein
MTTAPNKVNARSIEERYLSVRDRIWHAAQKHGRDPSSVKLVAVTKTFEEEAILPVICQGHFCFGENRVQEAMRKWPPLRERYPEIELHLIGPLQSNKAKEAVALFDCIETVDRPKIAAALAAEMRKQARSAKLFVQVNIGSEPQKAGIDPSEAEKFVGQCEREFSLHISGLMAIPPIDADPRPYFESLAALRDRLALPELSMGMSADFEEAIARGATVVRVGSAIFGGR